MTILLRFALVLLSASLFLAAPQVASANSDVGINVDGRNDDLREVAR